MNRGLAGNDANSFRLNPVILLRIELCQNGSLLLAFVRYICISSNRDLYTELKKGISDLSAVRSTCKMAW
jgi:hypothetical protein